MPYYAQTNPLSIARISELIRYESFFRTLFLKAALMDKIGEDVYNYILKPCMPVEFREYM